jgi:hypothetical protein
MADPANADDERAKNRSASVARAAEKALVDN